MEIKEPEIEKEESDEDEMEEINIDTAELELIKKNPYNYICDFYERMFPRTGKRVFSILSLVPCSILIPKIDSEVKQIKQKISLLWISPSGSGKTSIGSEFKKIAYNPLSTQKITPARLVYEINKITKNEEVPKLTLIVSDIAQMFSDDEFIKLLEGVIGDEAEFSRNTMKNAKNGTSKKVDACAYLSGTSKNIFDNKVRDGILGRTSSLVTFFSENDNEEIINHINSRMGKPIKNNEINIIKDFYQDLYSIQLGNHKTIEPINGYEISEEIRSEIGRFVLELKPSKLILQKWGLTSARILEETYRFLVNHAFLNVYNRKIIDNKLVISREDLIIAKQLAYQESVQTFRILRGIEAIDYFNIQTERDLRNFEKKMEQKNKPVSKETDYILRGGLKK